MKKKLFATLCSSLALAAVLTACGGTPAASSSNAQSETETQAPAAVEYQWDFKKKTTDIDSYKSECDEKGSIVSLNYETPAYAFSNVLSISETITKQLYIYLPYGYDETQNYNILYLMHGGGESEEYWLAGEQWGQYTCNVLDNMIKEGLCDPVIVVTPTFYSPVDGYEVTNEQAAAYAAETLNDESVGDINAIYTIAFAQELRNNIIPAVESHYSTYANGDTSAENLIATRDHRAFAGLSMGSMTSIRSGLMQCTDLFSYFGSYSGSLTTAEQFQSALENDALKDFSIKFWYNGNGKGDIAFDEHNEFAHAVLELMPERFVDGKNFAWVSLRDGAHMYGSWIVDLYNCLLVFYTL